MEEYEVKFNELSQNAPEMVGEHHDKVEMFENGLRLIIKEKVTFVLSKTFQEAVEVAKRGEEMSKVKKTSDGAQRSWDQKKRPRHTRTLGHPKI